MTSNPGSTQLYTFEYNNFGKVTKMIDPVGRMFSYIYDANGKDLEMRQMSFYDTKGHAKNTIRRQ